MIFAPFHSRAGSRPTAGKRISSNLAAAAVCLILMVGGAFADGPDQGAPSASPAISFDPDAEAPRPLAFKPLVPRPLTPGDLPPPNVFAAVSVLRGTNISFDRDWRAGRNEYRAIIEREALGYGLPPALVDAVMAVESGYNPAAVGMDGEIGLMQVMPATARMLGFTGTVAQLVDPQVNIHYGTKYLAGAWRLASADLCTATMKYRAGHGETRFSFRSVDYCVSVRNHLLARGVAVTGKVPRPTFGAEGGNRARGRLLAGTSERGIVNFAALNARLRALTDRIAARNGP